MPVNIMVHKVGGVKIIYFYIYKNIYINSRPAKLIVLFTLRQNEAESKRKDSKNTTLYQH